MQRLGRDLPIPQREREEQLALLGDADRRADPEYEQHRDRDREPDAQDDGHAGFSKDRRRHALSCGDASFVAFPYHDGLARSTSRTMNAELPTDRSAKVLVVEDDAAMRALVASVLAKRGSDVSVASSANEAIGLFEAIPFDVVVSDVRLGGRTGLELCEELRARRADVPVVLVTAFSDLDTAIAAIRSGAHDFLPKPFELDELALRVERAVELRRLRAEVTRLREGVVTPLRFEDLIGPSPAMQRVFAMVERFASSDAPVLVTGETGTGKELVARAIHARSAVGRGPFVVVHCAALPEDLLETELFGHAKTSLSDARSAPGGKLFEADGGTLFLDDVAALPLSVQAKLLRVLQEGRVRPVFGERDFGVRVRLVSATSRDLDALVAEGSFRDDLYYRIAVLPMRLPPLRERGSDVLALATEYLRRIATRAGKRVLGLGPETARKLVGYSWPGNVTELVNAVERAVALAEHDALEVVDLPEKIQAFSPSHVIVAGDDPSELVCLEEVERRYILRVVEAVGGNRSRAAEILKVDRKTLYSKLKTYGWRPADGGPTP